MLFVEQREYKMNMKIVDGDFKTKEEQEKEYFNGLIQKASEDMKKLLVDPIAICIVAVSKTGYPDIIFCDVTDENRLSVIGALDVAKTWQLNPDDLPEPEEA